MKNNQLQVFGSGRKSLWEISSLSIKMQWLVVRDTSTVFGIYCTENMSVLHKLQVITWNRFLLLRIRTSDNTRPHSVQIHNNWTHLIVWTCCNAQYWILKINSDQAVSWTDEKALFDTRQVKELWEVTLVPSLVKLLINGNNGVFTFVFNEDWIAQIT
jgi:hypothetical protein